MSDLTYVRDLFVLGAYEAGKVSPLESAAFFDRLLAAHDAEVRADEREEVLDRQKTAMFDDFRTNANGNLVLHWETAVAAARGETNHE